jgi:Protein of unknown function (DUF1360)
MASTLSREAERIAADYSGEHEAPLGGYATLMGVFIAVVAGFSTWIRRSGRELPERISSGDIALLTVATHKASRLITKDRVTSAVRAPFTEYQADGGPAEVEERARGRGLRRALGELLVCPYCLGMWIATLFAIGLVVLPRPTRWAAAVLCVHFGADMMQLAYKKLEDV